MEQPITVSRYADRGNRRFNRLRMRLWADMRKRAEREDRRMMGYSAHPEPLPRMARMGGVRSPYYRPAPHTNRYTRPIPPKRRGFAGVVEQVKAKMASPRFAPGAWAW